MNTMDSSSERSMSMTRNEMANYVGDEYTPLDQLVSPVGPQFTIPFTSVDSEGQPMGEQEHIHLYGQSQFHHNLGPVYAVPTYPMPHGGEGGIAQPQESSMHPHIFDQGQFHHNLGPVYAIPTYPWPHGNNPHAGSPPPKQGSYQHTGSGQLQQGGVHPHAMVFPVYCCGCHPMRRY